MYLLSGGKTGGHIIPLINIAKHNKNEFIYVGCNNYLENELCKNNQIKFIGFNHYDNKMIMISKAFFYLKKELKNIKIDKIIISGGFVSLPLALYSYFNKIPLYLIECNTTFGLVNKMMYPYAKSVFYAFNKIKEKGEVTGLVVDKKSYFNNECYDILIIGGSLGSKPLCNLAKELSQKYKIVLICGKYYDEYKNLKGEVISYTNDIIKYMTLSKIIISRSGGMTLSEAIYYNKPLITIPSNKTKGNHQKLNAKFLEDLGLLKSFDENDEFSVIDNYINQLLHSNDLRLNMKNKQRNFKKDSLNMILKEIEYNEFV